MNDVRTRLGSLVIRRHARCPPGTASHAASGPSARAQAVVCHRYADIAALRGRIIGEAGRGLFGQFYPGPWGAIGARSPKPWSLFRGACRSGVNDVQAYCYKCILNRRLQFLASLFPLRMASLAHELRCRRSGHAGVSRTPGETRPAGWATLARWRSGRPRARLRRWQSARRSQDSPKGRVRGGRPLG